MFTHHALRPATALILLTAAAIFSGCNQAQWSRTAQIAPPAMPPPAPSATNPAAAPTQAPYVLSAKSGGPFVEFSIYNLGDTEIPITRNHFAIISPNTREVTPYSSDTTVIDLPQSATVKPGETIHGRAMFRNVANPIGKRLVFKPDDVGTFADIIR